MYIVTTNQKLNPPLFFANTDGARGHTIFYTFYFWVGVIIDIMKKVVLINGKKQSKLNVFNRLTQFGDGLFETCVIKDRKLLFWSVHFARLEKGRIQLKINKVGEEQWTEDISKALGIAKLEQAVVKIILSRGESERGYGFKKTLKPTRIVIVSPMPAQIADKYTLSVCHSGYVNNALLSHIKHCNRLEQILARINMHGHECIMLNEKGNPISVTQGNIFGIKDAVLLTPNLDNCGIEGTRRAVILAIALKLKLQVKVGELTLKTLYDCDEVFISNSVMGVKSVDSINAKQFTCQTLTQKIAQGLVQESQTKQNSVLLKPSDG